MNPLRIVLVSILFVSAGCTHGASDATHPATSAGVSTTGAHASAEPAPNDVSETPNDLVITQRLRTLFTEDSELASVQRRVIITTAHEVVTLTGSVVTERQRGVMAAHARAVEGVTHLDDQIALAP